MHFAFLCYEYTVCAETPLSCAHGKPHVSRGGGKKCAICLQSYLLRVTGYVGRELRRRRDTRSSKTTRSVRAEKKGARSRLATRRAPPVCCLLFAFVFFIVVSPMAPIDPRALTNVACATCDRTTSSLCFACVPTAADASSSLIYLALLVFFFSRRAYSHGASLSLIPPKTYASLVLAWETSRASR